MLFPGSRLWYEGAAADLAALTDEIKSSGFSGHVVLEFQESLDIVICVGGEFLRVFEKIGRRVLTTKKYREIWGKCQIKQGRMQVFELPPPLVRRLRGLHGRHLLCSGTATTGCAPERILGDLRSRSFSGVLDCVTPGGKLLLDIERGAVIGCYYTEYEGLSRAGLPAFVAWHRAFVHSTHPSFFFTSESDGPGDGQLWEEILMDYADQVPLPMASSIERLYRAFGREAAPGEQLLAPESSPRTALYLVSGEIELIPKQAAGWSGGPTLKPGEFFGIGRLCDGDPAPIIARARTASRYLELDARSLETVFANSPVLGERLVREVAAKTTDLRARLRAFRAEPRLRDVESAVLEALVRHPQGGSEGIPAAELFRELTQSLPLSLKQIDALFRRLATLEGLHQAGGRISLKPREF